MFHPKNTDPSWTLFLDRDGVINHQKEGSYILHWDEFVFYDGVLSAMPVFARLFKYVFIITNQRGVGKGLMTEQQLQQIHHNMKEKIEQAGGRIDGIYFCTALDAASPCRKPNTGMALQAREDYPEIDFSKSIMVGNSYSDMDFGRGIGATTIFVTTTHQTVEKDDERIDAVYGTLQEFAAALSTLR